MSRIPHPDELQCWRSDFKQRYKRAHTPPAELIIPTNDFQDDRPEFDSPEAAKTWVEGQEAATFRFSKGMDSFGASAHARGEGFARGWDHHPADANPHPDGTDEFYSWYAGWLQGQHRLPGR